MAISRKQFLKNMAVGTVAVPFIFNSCSSDSEVEDPDNGGTDNGGTTNNGSGTTGNDTCTLAPSETEGPFPTHNPSSYVRKDIRDDREGVELSVSIQINDQSNSCSPIEGAIVDIWHCDADGNYSEYGGIRMQTANYTNVHFLRGRQVTDSEGKVAFTTIFPGWYQSRATHIHVHIYDSSGNSLKITQISFPEGDGSAVEIVNSSEGESYGYTKGMSGYTYNSNDNVFSDDDDNVEMATVSGNLSDGFELSHKINV